MREGERSAFRATEKLRWGSIIFRASGKSDSQYRWSGTTQPNQRKRGSKNGGRFAFFINLQSPCNCKYRPFYCDEFRLFALLFFVKCEEEEGLVVVGSKAPLDLPTSVAEVRSLKVAIRVFYMMGAWGPATLLRVFRFIRELKTYPLAQVPAFGGKSASD